jgi:hypothetical protein
MDASGLDADAAQCANATLYVDTDGDGLGSDETAQVQVCSGVIPPGYAVSNGDCDPSDPSRMHWVYPDHDGDGFGVDADRQCVGEPTPDGFVLWPPGDCDDDDPLVSPDAPEQWSDGVDSNCDGEDAPADCSADKLPCGCVEAMQPPAAVVKSPACVGIADLAIESTVRCLDRCPGPETVYVVIGNHGSIPSPAGVPVRVSVPGKASLPVYIHDPVQPGTSTLPLMVDAQPGQALVFVDIPAKDDCDASNNSVNLVIALTDCN